MGAAIANTPNCCLNICSFLTTAYLKRMKFSPVNTVFTCSPSVATLCSLGAQGTFRAFLPSPSNPSPTPAASVTTNQNASLCLDNQSENGLIPSINFIYLFFNFYFYCMLLYNTVLALPYKYLLSVYELGNASFINENTEVLSFQLRKENL